ncbi:MAG: PsiF family protein, partial [Pseudomonadota bacterium]
MKQLIAACALALPFLAGQAFAQGSAPAAAPAAPAAAPAAKNSQQDKMKQCNMDAAGKKG